MKLVDGTLQTDYSDKIKVAREVADALLGNRIPITKIIGFKINQTTGVSDFSVIERNTACLETVPEIATRISQITFNINMRAFVGYNEFSTGVIKSSEFCIWASGKKVCPLEQDIDIMHLSNPVEMRVMFRTGGTGDFSIEDSAKFMRNLNEEGDHFPCAADFTLQHLIRIKPHLEDGEIKYQASKSVNIQTLEDILNTHFSEY